MPKVKREKEGAEPKRRSRTGCWPCKARKVKCGEEKPACSNCVKSGERCDYSIRLNWSGRVKRENRESSPLDAFTFVATPSTVSHANAAHERVFSSQHISTPPVRTSSQLAGQQTSPTSAPSLPIYDPRLTNQAQTTHSTNAPPYHAISPPASEFSPEQTSKRLKLSPRVPAAQTARNAFQGPLLQNDNISPGSKYFTPSSMDSVVSTPTATPNSSLASPLPALTLPNLIPDPPDLRKLSVKSLLADPIERSDCPLLRARYESQTHRIFGYDHGLSDLDIPHNNDAGALHSESPDMRRPSIATSEVSTGSAEGRDVAFEPGGYYAKPVAVRLSKSLDPLPQELLKNPMSMLYFHFFINHTSRIMVPHDCPENPLRRVLPRMAARNRQVLHLLLAFAASNRAKLLGHDVPANRIAEWMSDVLPAMRQALDRPATPQGADASDLASLAPLTMAIMMSSLEILSPTTFDVPISWQNHLDVARQLLVNYGGLSRIAVKANGVRDSVVFLISRWFAYLDVLGSLSGGKQRQPLMDAYLEDGGGIWLVNRDDEEVHRIDCFFGFSGTCIALLASVASLAAECDSQRINPTTGAERTDWRPTEAIIRRANELREKLEASALEGVPAACMAASPENERAKTQQDREEVMATNQAFHWAGMIHISRRVLGLRPAHPQVQDGVHKVLEALVKVRPGSNAEDCLLFPMFSAGCEAVEIGDRQLILDRLKSIGCWSMQHVARAKNIIERVWETGMPWEVLVNGEFFG